MGLYLLYQLESFNPFLQFYRKFITHYIANWLFLYTLYYELISCTNRGVLLIGHIERYISNPEVDSQINSCSFGWAISIFVSGTQKLLCILLRVSVPLLGQICSGFQDLYIIVYVWRGHYFLFYHDKWVGHVRDQENYYILKNTTQELTR